MTTPATWLCTNSSKVRAKLPDDFDFRTAFAEIHEQTQLDADTIRAFIADRALADAVADHLASRLDPVPAQIRASQIVVPTEEDAETVVARLKALQPFALVAEQDSIDTGSAAEGGDLGWLPRGLMPVSLGRSRLCPAAGCARRTRRHIAGLARHHGSRAIPVTRPRSRDQSSADARSPTTTGSRPCAPPATYSSCSRPKSSTGHGARRPSLDLMRPRPAPHAAYDPARPQPCLQTARPRHGAPGC